LNAGEGKNFPQLKKKYEADLQAEKDAETARQRAAVQVEAKRAHAKIRASGGAPFNSCKQSTLLETQGFVTNVLLNYHTKIHSILVLHSLLKCLTKPQYLESRKIMSPILFASAVTLSFQANFVILLLEKVRILIIFDSTISGTMAVSRIMNSTRLIAIPLSYAMLIKVAASMLLQRPKKSE